MWKAPKVLRLGMGSPETMRKLCGNLFTKFPLQEIRANYGILRSVCYSGLFHFANQMPKFIFRIMIEAQ